MNIKGLMILIAVVSLTAGWFLGDLIGVPGLGSGDGGAGGGGGPDPIVDPETPPVPPSVPPSVPPPVLPEEQGAVVVKIENDRFSIRESSGAFKLASLNDVLEQVKNTQPNTKGIRVCIRRERDGKAGTLAKLVEKLKEAGVEDDQIDWDNDQLK